VAIEKKETSSIRFVLLLGQSTTVQFANYYLHQSSNPLDICDYFLLSWYRNDSANLL